jgi:hypothetical protein
MINGSYASSSLIFRNFQHRVLRQYRIIY